MHFLPSKQFQLRAVVVVEQLAALGLDEGGTVEDVKAAGGAGWSANLTLSGGTMKAVH